MDLAFIQIESSPEEDIPAEDSPVSSDADDAANFIDEEDSLAVDDMAKLIGISPEADDTASTEEMFHSDEERSCSSDTDDKWAKEFFSQTEEEEFSFAEEIASTPSFGADEDSEQAKAQIALKTHNIHFFIFQKISTNFALS